MADPGQTSSRAADPASTANADIRAAEKRRIPLDVMLKSADRYPAGGPVRVTIVVTNLFNVPLCMNSRMLVNHALLHGEVSFRIVGPGGKKIEIQRLITPLSLREEDFVTLARGESMQRAVDLADLYGISRHGIYKVQVSYHNDEQARSNAAQPVWKGEVWSDPVEIRLD